jgi:hypothetical protein
MRAHFALVSSWLPDLRSARSPRPAFDYATADIEGLGDASPTLSAPDTRPMSGSRA